MILYSFEHTQIGTCTFIKYMSDEFPKYMHQPDRLESILDFIRTEHIITVVIEPDYVDKQYRDSFYVYFAQKYREFERNCLRLAIFEGEWSRNRFANAEKPEIQENFIGIIVLRPLYIGMIGKTLINPTKYKLSGYLQTCNFKSTIAGRKIEYQAFPFSSQDNETMTCAQTSLYNLISYYGRKYPEYRALMPNEILHHIESTHYERVLPANGLQDEYIAKVLMDTHFYPRLYKEINNFKEVLHIYVESGIPFILGLPWHAVNCIGYARVDKEIKRHSLERIVKQRNTEKGNATFYLNTSELTDEYIIMDDNSIPYKTISLDEITKEYYDKGNYSDEPDANMDTIIDAYNSMIVPLYRRVYIDAPKAKDIVDSLFLENELFLETLRKSYIDTDWGKTYQNPIVWRMYLTTSNKYRDFKVRTASNDAVSAYYMDHSFPHFIWVLEIGTISTLKKNRARVEIILDASSSRNSESRAVLSIACKEHYLFLPDLHNETINAVLKGSSYVKSAENKSQDSPNFVKNKLLTAAMLIIYNGKDLLFGEDFECFYNLEEVV